MLPLPADNPTNPILLADWLELVAMLSADRNSSRGDIEAALRRAAYCELLGDEDIELAILEVFTELQNRVDAALDAYPFALIDGGLVQLRTAAWSDYPAYTFCLVLSYFGLPDNALTPRLFERLSQNAAGQYVAGSAIGFGHPRHELPPAFPEAVAVLCQTLGEGGGFRLQPALGRKDDTLDLVAWSDFPDRLPGKIIIYGQCAAGKNWEEKTGELNPEAFSSQWMQMLPCHPPLKSFFFPHRIDPRRWELVSRKAGVLFDRCRIAYWAQRRQADYSDHIRWTQDWLRQNAG